MSLTIKKAVKSQAKLRLALSGPAGAGKTWTSLQFASILAEGGNILVIDTEHGRAEKYADEFDFDTVQLDTFNPKTYIDALQMGYQAGYSVIVIDSLTHAWAGEGGALEMVDGLKRQKGSSFNAWADVTPLQNKLINTMQAAPCHIIATMRSKTEYSQEVGANGKTSIRKLGTVAIQRDGVDFEFDVFGMLSREHVLTIEKSVCRAVPVNAEYSEPGPEIAQTLLAWLKDGADAPPATTDQLTAIRKGCELLGVDPPAEPLTFQRANDLIADYRRQYQQRQQQKQEATA